MEGNPIERIRDAERRADEILRKAAQESVSIRETAYIEAARARTVSESEAKAAAAQMLALAQQKSRQMLEETDAAVADEVQALCRRADEEQSAAVQAVIALLINE